jgi:hypothetical protein
VKQYKVTVIVEEVVESAHQTCTVEIARNAAPRYVNDFEMVNARYPESLVQINLERAAAFAISGMIGVLTAKVME